MIRLSTMYFFNFRRRYFFHCAVGLCAVCYVLSCWRRLLELLVGVASVVDCRTVFFVISHHSHSSMSEPPENKRMARAVLWKLPLARSSTKRRRSDCGACAGLMHLALRGSVARRLGLRCCQKLGLVLMCCTVEHTQYKYLAPARL